MAKNYIQGIYTVQNREKYIGQNIDNVIYRSGWELNVFITMDKNPAIRYWSSESIQIPYYNPFTKRSTIYIPDLFVVYVDKDGKQHAEVLEIKPLKETGMGKTLAETRSQRDKAAIILNQHKWAAAMAWCKKNNFGFRVLTEQQLFHTGNQPARNTVKRRVVRKK